MRELIARTDLAVPGEPSALGLYREDLSHVYPGMARFLLLLEVQDRRLVLFSTNTYEYPPLLRLGAEEAARQAMAAWEEAIVADPERLHSPAGPPPARPPAVPRDVLILQGSPRPDGSCAVLAGWAAEAAVSAGQSAEVVFVHDLEVHACIGCYQCYNTGVCTFDDEMTALGAAIRAARLLVVCTPVYTNTVPAGLKAVLDRAQAIRAVSALGESGSRHGQRGVLLATAGRQGPENFRCVQSVVGAFMANLGISSRGEVLVDDLDRLRDLRQIDGLELRVRSTVLSALSATGTTTSTSREP
jgi:multimeric flavodoxin WrbA